MIDRLTIGYIALIALSVGFSIIGFLVGNADLSHYAKTGGLEALVASSAMFPLLWLMGVSIQITRRQYDRPIFVALRSLRTRWKWMARGSVFFIIIVLFARSFSSFKTSIPVLNAFWADPWIIKLDYLIFGEDPWIVSHRLLGEIGTVFLDRVYILWFTVMFTTLAWFLFTRNDKLQVRGLMCYIFCWAIVGGLFAVIFSSVGPCFYENFYGDSRFVPLMNSLEHTDKKYGLFALRTMNFLVRSIGEDKLGAGISAMPSLHVTIAFLSFLAVKTYSPSRLLKLLSGLFAAAIFVGSVHLGWHYAWDGIFGIIAVTLFWWGTGKFVDWVEARELAQAARVPATPLPATS